MKGFLKKLLSIPLCVALVGCTLVNLPTVLINSSIVANAANITNDGFGYKISDDTVEIVGYYGRNKEAIIPSEINGKKVTVIGHDAFNSLNGKEITSISIPNTIITIENSAFEGCSGLTKLTIPYGVTNIGDRAFRDCSGLTKVTVPNSVTNIGNYAFSQCVNLTSFCFPNSMTKISDSILYGCENLTSVTISFGITTIEESAFDTCTNLKSINIPDSVTNIGICAFWGCKNLENITIPDSVTNIGRSAFKYCEKLINVNFGNGVTKIDDGAFSGCLSLMSVELPNSVTTLGSSVFAYCPSLTNVSIPKSVTDIGSGLFGSCEQLTSIEVDTENKKYLSYEGVLFNKDKTELIEYPSGRTGTYTIPSSVLKIGTSAFYGCKNLTDIIIPYAVKTIGDFAFSMCKRLPSITIPNSVTNIGKNAFSSCERLSNINLSNNIVNIEDSTFLYCKNLVRIIIPKNVISIGRGAFWGCEKLTNLLLPQNVTSIGDYAFYQCESLTNITIPKEVTNIGEWTFASNGRLTVNISESVTSIDDSAFLYCSKVIIYGIKGSYAENFANQNKISFIETTSYDYIDRSDPTCTENGKQCYYYNPLNNKYYSDSNFMIEISDVDSWGIIPATKHNYILLSEKSATCAEDGEKIYQCVNCGEEKSETMKAIGHSYKEELIIPTTDEEGYTLHTCENCGESYKDNYTAKLLANRSVLSAETISLGGKITVTATATGSTEEYLYQVLYKKKTQSKWTIAQDFGTNDTVTIKPANATDYDVCVKVKDGSGKIVKKYFEVKVNAKLANTSALSAENITLGQQITVNGLAQGGMGEYQYQVVYKQTSQSKWTTAQAFSENATVTFKPAKATTYDVCVKVKDSNGTIVKKFFTVQVNAKLTNTSTVSATTIKKGNTVTVNGSATGGAGDYTYAVFYKQKAQTKWTTKQDFNDNADVSIKPAQATDYDICVKVKDKDGTIVKKYFTVTVTK